LWKRTSIFRNLWTLKEHYVGIAAI